MATASLNASAISLKNLVYSWKKKQIKNKKKGMKNWKEPDKKVLKNEQKSAQNLLGVSSEVSGRGTQCGEQPHTSINRAK